MGRREGKKKGRMYHRGELCSTASGTTPWGEKRQRGTQEVFYLGFLGGKLA